jgi:hypothetical protein
MAKEDERQQADDLLPISMQSGPPKRNGRWRVVAVLAAVLVVVVVLGYTIRRLVSGQSGNQINPGGVSSGGPAIINGRFFTIHQSVIYLASGSGKVVALRSDKGAFMRSYTIGDGGALGAPVIAGNVLYESNESIS